MSDVLEAVYEYLFERFAKYVVGAVLVVSLLYGAITGSPQKAGQLYFQVVQFLIAPIVRSDERMMQEIFQGIQKSTNQNLGGKTTH